MLKLLANFSARKKIRLFNYYSKTKGFYFRIIIKQFNFFSHKISQIGFTWLTFWFPLTSANKLDTANCAVHSSAWPRYEIRTTVGNGTWAPSCAQDNRTCWVEFSALLLCPGLQVIPLGKRISVHGYSSIFFEKHHYLKVNLKHVILVYSTTVNIFNQISKLQVCNFSHSHLILFLASFWSVPKLGQFHWILSQNA